MTAGFAKPTLQTETSDGRYFRLLEPLVFTDSNGTAFRAPEGTTSDGASTPKEIWPIIPPFGTYWLGAVLHDAAYRDLLEKWIPNDTEVKRDEPGAWVKASLSKDECDSLLLDAMESLGVDEALRDAIYEGVHLGGEASFAEDRKEKVSALVLADLEGCAKRILERL